MMQTAYLNNVLRLPAAAVLCLILFSACSGNADPPAPADQTTFNAALADITTAVTAEDYVAAEAAFVSFAAAYPNSSLVDDAEYYIGRSMHELALLKLPAAPATAYTLLDARNQYLDLLRLYPTSNKADNAQYQIGRTWFDDGVSYANAIEEFNKVFSIYTATAGAADDARYYLGRAKHELALLPALTYTLQNARDEYLALLSIYPLSTRRDDAQYQIGRTYFDVANYADAFTELSKVFNTNLHTAPSVGDDARYYLGRAKHELALLATPTASVPLFAEAHTHYGLVLSAYPVSNRRDDAQYQIGRTYFDEDKFALALVAFEAVLTPARFTAPSVGDDAQYYKARAIHALANIPAAGYSFALARTEYSKVSTGYPLSNRLDDTQYQIGRTHFDDLNYVAAIIEFDKALANYALIPPPAGYALAAAGDDAQFYKARAIHELAQIGFPSANYTLDKARTEYGKFFTVSTIYAASTRRDDAQYQIGRTHYDALIPVALDYTSAIAELDKVLANFIPSAISDDAQYFRARAMHQLALLPAPTLYTLSQARDEYVRLMSVYPTSTRLSNAQYQIGITYYEEGNFTAAIAAFEKLNLMTSAPAEEDHALYIKARATHELAKIPASGFNFALARTEYAKVNAANFPRNLPLNSRIDDAAFYAALTYHDAKECAAELIAMGDFVTAYPASALLAEAKMHIADLNAARQSHTGCI